jgi:Tol biopolymer transport system component
MIVCRLGEGLQLRKLNSTQFIPLRGTKDAVEPFWSPDSKWIGFSVKGSLMKMQVPDGAPELLWKPAGVGGTWGSSGTILVGGEERLQAVPEAGGSASTLPKPKSMMGLFYPHFLPDGEHFLFFGGGPTPSEVGPTPSNLYLGGWSNGKWTLLPVLLRANCGEARYSQAHGGAVLFVQNDNLYAQKLNLAQARLEGSPVLLETSVASMGGMYPDTASFSVSSNGVLAWRPGRPYTEQLTWFDRHGNLVGTVGPPSWYLVVRLSPDERRIAALVGIPGGSELRVLETGQSGFLTILKPFFYTTGAVVWRGDSLHLLYTSENSGESFLVERSATGSSEMRQLGKVPAMTLNDISPDGTLLGMIQGTLHVVPPEGDRTPRPLLASEEQTRQGAFSPDGRWVVYASALAQELFVQSFPISGPRRQISTGGGTRPYWRRDGKEILYLGPDSWLYSVRLDPARGEFQPPERLFAVRIGPNNPVHFTLAATRDGSRILFDQAIDQPESRVITVALHR